MTCLSIVQDAYGRLGLTKPNAAITSADAQVIQMVSLLNEEGKTLAKRTNLQAITREATFTTVALEGQGALTTIAPKCRFILNQTIWNRTLRMPVFGPLSPQDWQQQKAMYLTGPWNQYRVVGGQIKFIPIPTAGQLCAFEYVTTDWCTSSGGVTARSAFAADDDVALMDEDVMTLGLIWRWKQAKGFDFVTDLKKYEAQVQDMIGRDASKPVLNMGDALYDIPPIVILPAGNWPI